MINSLRIFFRDRPNGLVVRPKVESPHLAVGGIRAHVGTAAGTKC